LKIIKSFVGGLFCFNFLNDKVNSEQSTPIGHNVLRLCVCLPLAQSFKFTTNVDGANSTKPMLGDAFLRVLNRFLTIK